MKSNLDRHFISSLRFYSICLALILTLNACRKEPEVEKTWIPATAADVKKLAQGPKCRATVVNLWATWCEPCREEMPALAQLAKELKKQDVQFIFVSADEPTVGQDVALFLKTAGVEGPTYRLGETADVFAKNFAPQWSATLPATFILDSTGRISSFIVGKTDSKAIQDRVEKAIKASLASPLKIESDASSLRR